jgi:hypothetical protein
MERVWWTGLGHLSVRFSVHYNFSHEPLPVLTADARILERLPSPAANSLWHGAGRYPNITTIKPRESQMYRPLPVTATATQGWQSDLDVPITEFNA